VRVRGELRRSIRTFLTPFGRLYTQVTNRSTRNSAALFPRLPRSRDNFLPVAIRKYLNLLAFYYSLLCLNSDMTIDAVTIGGFPSPQPDQTRYAARPGPSPQHSTKTLGLPFSKSWEGWLKLSTNCPVRSSIARRIEEFCSSLTNELRQRP